MGFRCSILGCEYERAEPEREREQRGDEVIHTVREYERCTRCGERRLVSENTGVTAARAVEADGSGSDPFAEAAPESDLTVEVEHDPTETGADEEGFGDDDFVETDLPDGSSYDPDAEDDAVILGGNDTADSAPDPGPASEPTAEPDDPEGFYEEFDDEPADEDDGVEFLETDGTADPATEAEATDTEADPEELLEDAEAAEESTVVEPAESEAASEGEDAVFVGDAAEHGAQADARTGTDADTEEPEPDQGAEVVERAAEPADSDVGGEFGEWPDEDPAEEPEYDHGAWPDPTDGEDEGFDAAPSSEGSAPLGADSDVEFSGLTPDGATAAGDAADTSGEPATGGKRDAEVLDGSTTAGTAGVAATEPEPEPEASGHDAAVQHGPGAQTTRTDVAGELFCECGFSAPPSDTPHRAGDLCPGCGTAYLSER